MVPAPPRSLLIELGTEELPPSALDDLAASFARGVCDGLAKRGISAGTGQAKTYCSPRRLAVWIPAVADRQPDQQQERRGPAVIAGFDASGSPTKALLGFAQSCGVEPAQLEKLETGKGAWFVYRANIPGQPTAALVPEILADALKALPIPRPMRWGDHDYAFVRPAHWLVMLHGPDVVDGSVFGLQSGRMSRGHRFHHPQPVHVAGADSWLDGLRAAKVLADPAERRARIRDEVSRVLNVVDGAPRLSAPLLDEIANLTEWPVAIACTFEREFLAVPREALVTTMQTNQKFVPVFDENGDLTEHFVGVANIESKDPAEIRKGYERVIRPRFADARFFFDEDLKTPLASYLESLKSVTYQKSLGSVWDKCMRVAELSRVIANRTGVDAALATRAASLSKCDLLTRMVGEFPELQGVMGRYYANADGEEAEVAQALEEVYRPRFAADAIAQDKIGQVLAVAERVDTLTGIFSIGQKPSGSKDPFALRRAALGLARTLIEGPVAFDLKAQLREHVEIVQAHVRSSATPVGSGSKESAALGGDTDPSDLLASEIYDFIVERLRGYYADQGIPGDAFEAVRVLEPGDLVDFDRRLRAVVEFIRLPEAQALAVANKRIGNILRQAGTIGAGTIDETRFETGPEHDLASALRAAQDDGLPLIEAHDYVGVLKRLARLREPVDTYFNSVMVMVDDAATRGNRLALLARVRDLFLRVADISLLSTG